MASKPISGQITRWRTSIREVWALIPGSDLHSFSPELSQLSLQLTDLSSNDGDDVLPGFVGQFGVHIHATQSAGR